MGKLKALIPVTLALAIAVAGSMFIYNWMDRQGAPPQVLHQEEQIMVVPVVVAATDLAWGTVLKKEMLRTASYMRGSLPHGYHTDPGDLVGRVLISGVGSNEAITEARVAPLDIRTGGVSAILDEGMRAVAVPGNRVAGISGFIQPGNRVDVLVTMTDPGTKEDMTKLILENVPVLATGTQIQHNAGGEPAPVDVYTLKVSPGDSEKLTLAASRGNIQLALRNVLDTESVLTPGARAGDTLTSLRAVEPRPAQNPTSRPRNPQPRSYSVEVINGDARDIKRF